MLVARRVTSRLGRTSGIGPTRIPFRRTVAALGRSQDEGSPVVADYDESVSPVQKRPLPDDETMAREWKPRAPVVTIMGHVDHGKTSLLDALRKTSVAKGEAGGITQHIGAFAVELPSGARITFLDTPGHAAFTSMRARGARVTDIVVLVVAADDGIMPQTIEAIHHARAAAVPLIVAINKCDRPAAKPMRVQQQLMEHDVVTEEMGGDVQCVCVSALKGEGLLELEEAVLALAEMHDLRGDATGLCEATVIESRVAAGKGAVATVLVQRGTLKPGCSLVFGNGKTMCRVRRVTDENGRALTSAGPSTPCEITGAWSAMPEAGDDGIAVVNDAAGKQCLEWFRTRQQRVAAAHAQLVSSQRRAEMAASLEHRMEELGRLEVRLRFLKGKGDRRLIYETKQRIARLEIEIKEMAGARQAGDDTVDSASGSPTSHRTHELKLIVKGDVHGSVEAVVHALENLSKLNRRPRHDGGASADGTSSTDKIHVHILHSAVGPITSSDVELLAAAQRCAPAVESIGTAGRSVRHFLIGFNVPQPAKNVQQMIQRYRIPTITHNIIYNLLDDVKGQLTGMLKPDYVYEVVGEAEVLQLFDYNQGRERVAGCRVNTGVLHRTSAGGSGTTASDGSVNKTRVLRQGVKVYEGGMKAV